MFLSSFHVYHKESTNGDSSGYRKEEEELKLSLRICEGKDDGTGRDAARGAMAKNFGLLKANRPSGRLLMISTKYNWPQHFVIDQMSN